MEKFGDLKSLEDHLKLHGEVIYVSDAETLRGRPPFEDDMTREEHVLSLTRLGTSAYEHQHDGLAEDARRRIVVPPGVFRQIQKDFDDETSSVRRLTTRPITLVFVYLDISDFSKMPSGVQLLVVLALTRLADATRKARDPQRTDYDTEVCIGDGYIYAWRTAFGATRFAGALANLIEREVARGTVPEFHFRVGVHIGPVRCFWDPGRRDWNYIGDGINDGNRVLSAIGKETDDVVFISDQVRSELLKKDGVETGLVRHLINRGRREDKHGKKRRVYEFNHAACDMCRPPGD